jgi:hypothetical protein
MLLFLLTGVSGGLSISLRFLSCSDVFKITLKFNKTSKKRSHIEQLLLVDHSDIYFENDKLGDRLNRFLLQLRKDHPNVNVLIDKASSRKRHFPCSFAVCFMSMEAGIGYFAFVQIRLKLFCTGKTKTKTR